MFAQQLNGLAVGLSGATFAHLLQRGVVGVFHADQKALETCLAIEMQDIGISDDVVSAECCNHRHLDVLSDDGFQQGPPGLF